MLKYILILLYITPVVYSGGESVFSRSNVELLPTSISILGCIIFTLLMEMMLHKLEHKADHDPAKKAFLHKIYEEMITLGFFSFGLILLIDFKVLKANNPNLQKFEFAHLWLFMFGIFLVMHNLVGFVVIHKNERNWIIADAEDFEKLLEDSQKYQPRKACCRMIFGGGNVHGRMEYQAMKHIFLSAQRTSTFDFRFAKYLQRATSVLLMEHLENISVVSWILLVGVGISYIAVITTMRGRSSDDLWFSFSFAVVLAICSVILMVIVRQGKANLIRKKVRPGKSPEPRDYPELMVYIHEDQKKNHAMSKSQFSSKNRRKTERSESGSLKSSETSSTIVEPEDLFPCGLKTRNVLWLNDMITLLQCFFLGLFCTLIINEAITDFGPSFGSIYIFAVIVEQGIVMLWSSPCTVKDVVLIQSTLELQHEIYEEVVDETAELLHLRRMIKRRIESQWPSHGGTGRMSQLKDTFAAIDEDNSNLLGSKELKELFKRLNFNLHKRQCDLIIEEMDKDLSGEVSFEEFASYLSVDDVVEVKIGDDPKKENDSGE